MDHDVEVRYARNISLPEIGVKGQKRLLASKVLVVGAGGLGAPLLMYLAASGVGTIGIIDNDRVALSNLQRQIIHETGDIGHFKVTSAEDTLNYLNPSIRIIPYICRLDASNVDKIVSEYDLVADCCDNFETRFLVNKTCAEQHKPLGLCRGDRVFRTDLLPSSLTLVQSTHAINVFILSSHRLMRLHLVQRPVF